MPVGAIKRKPAACPCTRSMFSTSAFITVVLPVPAAPVTTQIDEFLKACAGAGVGTSSGAPEIDYIHGTEEVLSLGKKPGAVGILLPPIAKDSFFETINGRGPLPRKSFSMGEADEKRFYLECRKLFG